MNKILTIIRQPFISLMYYSKHRDKNIWIFGEWFGQRACDNSLYFANYVSETYKNIKCYWIANEDADLHRLNKNIVVIKRDSKESKKLFKKCGVALMNQGFIDFSSSANNYFRGALTINLWHGVGWKKIYFDTMKHSALLKPLQIIYKKLTLADYHLVPSLEAEKVHKSAFLMNKFIKAGQPRNTILFEDSKDIKQQFLKKMKLKEDTKIISYLPTFRAKDNNSFIFKDETKLNEILSNNNSIIIQKRHFADKYFSNNNTINNIYDVSDLSAQEILQISDVLITDYSSCFTDFLIKNKPIVHYLYDYSKYVSNERDLYYTVDEICCGDVCYKYDELLECIKSALNNQDKDSNLRTKRREQFIDRENINNNKNIYDQIMEILNAK